MQNRWVRVFSVLVVSFALFASCTSVPASAEDDPWKAQVVHGPWREIWAGADVTKNNWSVYTGMTVSPFGTIHHDGIRVRAVGGYGQYLADGWKENRVHGRTAKQFRVTTSFAELMLGYQVQFGGVTLKGFAGAAGDGHLPDPYPGSSVVEADGTVTNHHYDNLVGLDWGGKAALELWLDVSDALWASVDVSQTTSLDSYWRRLRLGYRATPELSIGFEGASLGNVEYDGQRAGLFARYAWSSGEIGVSGGAVNELTEVTGAYGTLNVLYQY